MEGKGSVAETRQTSRNTCGKRVMGVKDRSVDEKTYFGGHLEQQMRVRRKMN